MVPEGLPTCLNQKSISMVYPWDIDPNDSTSKSPAETVPVRPYPTSTHVPPAEQTAVHVAFFTALAEGFKMLGNLFNFLSTASD